MRYKAQENEEGGLAALIEFVGCFPNSRWRASLELNLGLIIFDKGYLSEAGKHWEEAWTLSKNEKGPDQKPVADQAVCELLTFNCRLGNMDTIKSYLQEIEGRGFTGSTEQVVNTARESVSFMKRHPDLGFMCGPLAVNSILNTGKKASMNPQVLNAASTVKGTNLVALQDLANKVGLKYHFAKGQQAQKFRRPVSSIGR